jgi:hypothetical protein
MKWIDIVVICLAVFAVISVTVWRIVRKKQGKFNCDCSCGGGSACNSCSFCPSIKGEKDTENA